MNATPTDFATYLDSLDGAVVVGWTLFGLAVLYLVCCVGNMLALHGRRRG